MTNVIARYRFLKNKIRKGMIEDAFHVVRVKAKSPDEQLWKLGNRANVSSDHSTDFDASGSDPTIKDKRRVMAIVTSRELNRAYTIAEHAARGIFPCLEKLPNDPGRPHFDYKALATTSS